MPQNRLAAVGAFVIGGLLLFTVGLFFIGSRRMMFTDTIRIYAEFQSIAALATGATVRVSGMDAGEVEEIQVPTGPSGRFRVRMRVREDLHPLVRVDSIASIQNDGLVGNKFVQIQTGSDSAPQVADGGTIGSREPFDVAELMQMMSDTIITVNTMLLDVKGRLDEALVSISTVAADAQVLMADAKLLVDDLSGDVRAIMASGAAITADVQTLVAGVRKGEGTVGKLLNDDSLYGSVKTLAADAEAVMAAVRQASQEAQAFVEDLRGGDGPVKGLTGEFRQTLTSAREAMTDLAETTEALKRNFLFRGFFNRRGYFDLQDVSVAEYREGALSTGDRRALRIWIDGALLFEPGPSGERLSAGGIARLDSAMSQFVRYPPQAPLVVEGYAEELTGDERYLISQARARLVRDYLVQRFGLDTRYVATMPMGFEADDSPSGDRWSGVAPAKFVSMSDL